PTGLCRLKYKLKQGEMAGTDEPVVLIVEDEPDIVDTYELWLDAGYEVRTAESGDEGLRRLDDSVDVVLLDRKMPGLSGDELLERIHERGLDCLVAMVTAVEPDFDILEMGFDTYLTKPVRQEQLTETVEALLTRSEYDSLLQRYYAMVEKRAALDATKPEEALARNEEYSQLSTAIEELRDRLSETIGDTADDEEFIATIRRVIDDRNE
ncbi:MAG: two-component system response regulator AdeR, partial [Natronomonas sp.]